MEEEIKAIVDPPPAAKTPSPRSNKYNRVPSMPSHIHPGNLHEANDVAIDAIQSGVIDTPTKLYLQKSLRLLEQVHAHGIVTEHRFNGLDSIVNKRRQVTSGKHAILKDQIIATNPILVKKLEEAESMTNKRKYARSGEGSKKAIRLDPVSSGNAEEIRDEDHARIYEVIEVMTE